MTEALVHSALGMPTEDWVKIENFTVNYRPALMRAPDGSKYSMWPEMWATEWLLEREHQRSFKKNFQCLPAPEDFDYWQPTDFRYGSLEATTRTIISIDPAVTTKRTSDRTAIAVVSFSHSERKVCVREAVAVREPGPDLRKRVLDLLMRYRETVGIVVESNQGGNLWLSIFHDMPVPVQTITASDKKEVRAAALLDHYQKGRVLHEKKLDDLEAEMLAFPRGQHDDLPDAVAHAVKALTTITAPIRNRVKVA
jgi:predicted phage terminase large subunit-like protein